MAIVTFPLNNTNYTADDMALYFSNRTNGVLSVDSELATLSNSNMSVTVKPGRAWLAPTKFKGIIFGSNEDIILPIGIADGLLNRIDRIVVKYDVISNQSSIYVKKGVPSSSAVAPTLVRDKDIAWELGIATILIGKGVTTIRPQDITDTRLDSSVCGLVSDGINHIATDVLNTQFQDWFTNLKNQLDDNQATNLQNQIDSWNAFKTTGVFGRGIHLQGDWASLILGNKAGTLRHHLTTNPSNGQFQLQRYADGTLSDHLVIDKDAMKPAGTLRFLGLPTAPWEDIYLKGFVKDGNGYNRLPNGMIEMWGSVNITVDSASTASVVVPLPIAFPNKIVMAHANADHDITNLGTTACGSIMVATNISTLGKLIITCGGTLVAGSGWASGSRMFSITWKALGY